MTWYKCDSPQEFRNSMNYLRTIEDDRRDAAEARTRLWHYTNAEALFKIMANRTIRFSRIDKVNDLTEKNPLELGDVYKGTYIACFSHNEKESIPLWSMYTSRGNGVRIEFDFKQANICDRFIDIGGYALKHKEKGRNLTYKNFTSFMHDIEYSEKKKILPVYNEKGDVFVNTPAIAIEKSNAWDFEEETRIMMFTVCHHNEDMPDCIDFKLDFAAIKKIAVMFAPWMSPEIKQSIKLTVLYYLKDYSNIVDFVDSELEGKIR